MSLASLVTQPSLALGAADEQLGVLDDRLWAAATDAELVEGLAAAQALKAHLAALEASMLAEADVREIARKQLHWSSTTDWFTHLAGVTRSEGRRTVVHARTLVSERRATWESLRRGEASPTQAHVIVDAVGALPGSPTLREDAERSLLEQAGVLDASELARAGRHLAEVVDPDRAERRAEAALSREERAAHLERFLSIADDGAGGVRLKGRGSLEDAATIRAALIPLTKPAPGVDPDRPDRPDRPEARANDPRDHGARLWDALVETAQHSLDTDRAPASHGARPRVSITVDWETLAGLLDAPAGREALTDDGLRLSVAAVRRLACDADLIPVCLGTHGEVLDVGRAHRLVTPALWRAVVARDRHCTFPACTRPPVMCHAHHLVHWADGGPTCLDNLALVCGAHHRVLHDTPWRVRLNPIDARPEYLPPARASGTTSRERHDDWIRHRPRRE